MATPLQRFFAVLSAASDLQLRSRILPSITTNEIEAGIVYSQVLKIALTSANAQASRRAGRSALSVEYRQIVEHRNLMQIQIPVTQVVQNSGRYRKVKQM